MRRRGRHARLPTLDELEARAADSECYLVAEALAREFPNLTYETGFFAGCANPVHTSCCIGRGADHAWCVAPDGTIYDATFAQFDPNTAVVVAAPGTTLHADYHPWSEHHAAAHGGACLLRRMSYPDKCEVEGCDYDERWRGGGWCDEGRYGFVVEHVPGEFVARRRDTGAVVGRVRVRSDQDLGATGWEFFKRMMSKQHRAKGRHRR